MAGVVWWAPLCVAALLVVPSSQQYSNTPCLDAVRNQDPPRPGQRQHDCDEAGEYKPQQCHGSRCFCVDPLGQQMTQFETVGRHEAHTVSCACARQKTERGGRHGGPPTTCDRFGNFAPRQCIGSQCYCVDPLTGDRLGGIASVHVSQIDQLQCEPQHRRRLGVPDEGQPGRGRRLGGAGGRLGGAGRQLLGGRTPCWDELRTHEERTQPLLGAEKPNCDRTGKYHPKQCRGSECFCVDPYNNPVAQYRRSRGEAVDMGCLCSRREWELQQGGLLGLSVICDELGNFAPHQCVGSQCHCVEPLSGARLPGLESHIGELAQLDCAGHRRQLLGADRPCEDQRRSAPYGQPQPECDRAGKFAPVQCSGDLCRCVAPNGDEIEGYQHPVEHRASMSCVCARRSWELSKEGLDGLGHPVVCDKFGGFHLHQCEGSTCYCVDPATGQPEAGGASVHVAKLASLQCGGTGVRCPSTGEAGSTSIGCTACAPACSTRLPRWAWSASPTTVTSWATSSSASAAARSATAWIRTPAVRCRTTWYTSPRSTTSTAPKSTTSQRTTPDARCSAADAIVSARTVADRGCGPAKAAAARARICAAADAVWVKMVPESRDPVPDRTAAALDGSVPDRTAAELVRSSLVTAEQEHNRSSLATAEREPNRSSLDTAGREHAIRSSPATKRRGSDL